MTRLYLVRTHGLAIHRQLLLEEALYRASNDNFFLLNDGSVEASIVLGLSG